MKPYFLEEGLRSLVKTINGNENIYLGIRPYAFHAGNAIPLVVYPLFLCEEVEKMGKPAAFNIFVFINDWEQDKLFGPDTKKYPFNISPLKTTFQYTFSEENSSVSVVDQWQPVIEHYTKLISEKFPKTKVKLIRNSEMKKEAPMKRSLLYTVENPKKISSILRRYTRKTVLSKPISYAIAVCPFCFYAKGETRVLKKDHIFHVCKNCNKETNASYIELDYWFYHKPLAVPRLEICDIDICITGMDHYNENDYLVREKLIRLLGSKAKFPKTIYTPLLMGRNDDVMSKSRKNAEMIEIEELISLVRENKKLPKIIPPDDLNYLSMEDNLKKIKSLYR